MKKAQYKKERFLKNHVVKMTTDELAAMQAKIKGLSDEFNAYHADWPGAKVRFIKMAKGFTSNVAALTQQEIPQAEVSAQPTEDHASTADENQATKETESTRADEDIPSAEETARGTSSVALEEQAMPVEASATVPEEIDQARTTASVVPEETAPISSAPPAKTSINLPSASEAKKTKAVERAYVKKRKASASLESSAPKKAKTLTSSLANPID